MPNPPLGAPEHDLFTTESTIVIHNLMYGSVGAVGAKIEFFGRISAKPERALESCHTAPLLKRQQKSGPIYLLFGP